MVTGIWLGNDDDKPTKLAGGTVPTQIWSDFMAKAHAGLPPSNLPDAMSAAIPADQLQAGDPIGLLTGDEGTAPAEGGFIDQGGVAPLEPQPPAEERRSARNIGDLLGDLFGG